MSDRVGGGELGLVRRINPQVWIEAELMYDSGEITIQRLIDVAYMRNLPLFVVTQPNEETPL
jgi:hypothetical protein